MKNLNTFEYPKPRFWNRDADRINFINKEDFWKDELITKLGINNHPLAPSMGAASRTEVIARQEIVRILKENPELRKFVQEGIDTQIPGNQKFLEEFDPKKPHSSFVDDVYQLINLLEAAQTKPFTEGALELLTFLKNTISHYSETERTFGELMGREIEKASQLHGRTRFVASYDDRGRFREFKNSPGENDEGYGYRHFSFRLSSLFKLKLNSESGYWQAHQYKYWVCVILAIIFFPVGIRILMHNSRIKKKAFSPMIIEGVPFEIRQDIKEALEWILVREPKMLYEKISAEIEKLREENKVKEAKKIILPTLIPDSESGTQTLFEVYYKYDETGLKIRIINVYSLPANEIGTPIMPGYGVDFAGYSETYRNQIRTKAKKLTEDFLKQTFDFGMTSKMLLYVEETKEELLRSLVSIKSPNTDEEYKYYTLQQATDLPHIAPYYKVISEYRSFVGKNIESLSQIAGLLMTLVDKADQWKIPISFPEILPDNEHVIGFKTIYPIHLIGRMAPDQKVVKSEDLIPINSLPPLNGQIIGLTGQNGGGKTATINELSYLVFLAQSGLPVFGTGVHLNVKKTIGLIFNTRGEGSQLQNFLQKSKKVLEGVKINRSNSTVVMLDELGSGAQNDDGVELGKKILNFLHQSGVSTIYNTQLPEVAEYSEKELGAKCFQFTIDHQVRSGIGRGNAKILAEQVGIAELLDY